MSRPEKDVEEMAEHAEVLTPQEMLQQFEKVNVCGECLHEAPNTLRKLVRYSKLPFRQLVAQYETHITYTPMLLAQEFSRSAIARDSDFSTNTLERGTFWMTPKVNHIPVQEWDSSPERRSEEPLARKARRGQRRVRGNLVAQFAANDATQLADAAELIKPWVDGIDLNCEIERLTPSVEPLSRRTGCPQKWAYQEGIGCALLRKPDTVRDLVRTTKQRLGWDFPVTVKIRVDPNLQLTNELVTTAIAAGADVLAIHGRTRHQSSSGHPVNLDSIQFAVECSKGQIPCVANGDVFDLEGAEETRRRCGVNAVMSARGLLANPVSWHGKAGRLRTLFVLTAHSLQALFSGYDKTPFTAISEFVRISTQVGLIYPLFHRHVAYMIESHFTLRMDRVFFNGLTSYASVCDYLVDELGVNLGGAEEKVSV
ncbi:BZ3500_MvSof-1268-A1-R1_Chr12-1g03659 [Microbotryum saponariae]|uniref:BZ3500_MvSof-1268-A1-R1_Chr12-1g03659 protein n=1 Tax=Microbotryum saponariae TaxID=289078 RepID=A0A2X0NCF8_9BASI|nr:BZ3500_MvSof-1268-A1-R1_Chr12-1g03659 [Microbotryum saponariae]SDA05252.1 BZ3501_MvSof-1269-A2-R1_Chr12-1g03236 [Microbotryum saponariae]